MHAYPRITLLSVVLLAAIAPMACYSADATSPIGVWKTFDDKTGKARAIVRIYEQDGKLFGRIEQSFTPGGRTSGLRALLRRAQGSTDHWSHHHSKHETGRQRVRRRRHP